MKQLFFLTAIFLFSFGLTAQSFVDDNYEDLIDADESTVVRVNQTTFQYASIFVEDAEVDDDVDAKELFENIHSLVLVAMDDLEDADARYVDGVRDLESRYEELVNVKSKDGRFSLQVDETGGIVNEIVGIGTDGNSFMVGSVLCHVKLEDVGKIINGIDIDNWNTFKETSNIDYESLSVYPNPVSTSGELSIEIPEQLIGGNLVITDTNGKSIKVLKADHNEKTISVNGLKTGNYIVSISKDGVTLNRKVMVVQ